MFIEIFLTLCVLFFISVWFYSLRRESIEILQVEYANVLATLHDLLNESQPIIVRGCPVPPILGAQALAEVPRLNSFPLQGTYTLQTYRTNPELVCPAEQAAGIPILENIVGRTLAKELSIDTWIQFTYTDFMMELSGYFSVLKSFRTRVVLGSYGMVRPSSLYTCILVTEGTYLVSLVNKRSESFLPKDWYSRYPYSLTLNDTPLVGEIQFIDIILRPGTMIVIPAHCIYSLALKELNKFGAAVVLELDSPISNLAHIL